MNDDTEFKRKQNSTGASPIAKKSRGEEDDREPSIVDVAWNHYRSYLDSIEEDEDGGDFDELLEVISLLEDIVPPQRPINISGGDLSTLRKRLDKSSSDYESSANFGTIEGLLPVLTSICYLQLGSHAIDVAFASTAKEEEEEGALDKAPDEYLILSLLYFPANTAALSMLANYLRMNALATTQDVCYLYEKAAEHAHSIRSMAISLLEDEKVEDEVKEWVELLLLNGVSGCEFEGGDDEDEEDNDEDEEGEGDVVSDSEVEATSSFMAALLLSILGKHDEAAVYLKKFGVTHRIHPDVWRGVKTVHTAKHKQIDTPDGSPISAPASFRSTEKGSGGVLPPKLYKELCDVFRPNAVYWEESDYDHRGYYSYFLDLTKEMEKSPSNIIEDVIVNHLLPLAKRGLSAEEGEKIVGAEWWCHHRPISANLGHNLHFDTDEALLAEEQSITHPIMSSVLYLTGGADGEKSKAAPGGSTIVFDQKPDAKEIAPKIWASQARNNSYMIFPGDMLHGVLPCPGDESTDNSDASGQSNTEAEHRLTFMVGFWTRRVPDKMKDRKLYGPCGPMPPATEEHTWIREIASGYESDGGGGDTSNQDGIGSFELPCISPAWEELESSNGEKRNEDEEEKEEFLQMPGTLDHRFFVRNAPRCFYDSLMNKDECF